MLSDIAEAAAITVGDITVRSAAGHAFGITGGALAGDITTGGIAATTVNNAGTGQARGVYLGQVSGTLTTDNISAVSGTSSDDTPAGDAIGVYLYEGVAAGGTVATGTIAATAGTTTGSGNSQNAVGFQSGGDIAGEVTLGAITVTGGANVDTVAGKGDAYGFLVSGDIAANADVTLDAVTVNLAKDNEGAGVRIDGVVAANALTLDGAISIAGTGTAGRKVTGLQAGAFEDLTIENAITITAANVQGYAIQTLDAGKNSILRIADDAAITGKAGAGTTGDIYLAGAGDKLVFSAASYSQALIAQSVETAEFTGASVTLAAGSQISEVENVIVAKTSAVTLNEADVFGWSTKPGVTNATTVDGALTLSAAQKLYNLSGAETTATITLTDALTLTATTDSTFAGQFTGAGAVTKDGPGTLTLTSATSTNSGAFIVNEGTVVATKAAALGTGALTVGVAPANSSASAVFDIADGETGTFSGSGITGYGSLVKRGTGILIFDTKTITMAAVSIEEGVLAADTVTIGMGTGTGTTVANGATLAIVDGPSTLGNALALQSGATLLFIGASPALDAASKTVTFASGSRLDVADALLDGADHTLISNLTSAVDVAALQFSGLGKSMTFTKDGSNFKVNGAVVGAAPTAAAIAENARKALNNAKLGDMAYQVLPLAAAWTGIVYDYNNIGYADPVAAKIGDFLANELGSTNTAAVEAGITILTGMDVAKSLEVASQTAHRSVGNILDRVQRNNGLRAASDSEPGYGNRLWLAGTGIWEDSDRDSGNAGFKYDSYGMQLGYDRVFGGFTVGGSFAFSHGNYADKAMQDNDSNVENFGVNVYGTYNHSSGFFASIVGGYTYSDFDVNAYSSALGWNRSNYDADTWTIGTTLGYDARVLPNLTLTPSIGLYSYSSRTDKFNNTFIRGLEIKRHDVELPLSLAAQYNVALGDGSVLAFDVNGGYTYRFSDEGSQLAPFTYEGIAGVAVTPAALDAPRGYLNLGAGVTYAADRWDASLEYAYSTSTASDAHMLRAQVMFKF